MIFPFALQASALQDKKIVTITGKVAGDTKGYNNIFYYSAGMPKDSAAIRNGQFEITLPFTETYTQAFYTQYEISGNRGYRPFPLLIDAPGKINASRDSLSKLYKGKYVWIDFWATWCGPCRAENPNVVKAYAAYHPKGFEILGVSLDNDKGRENWLKAIEKDGLTWPQVSDLKYWENEVAKQYGVRAIPQNFLLDQRGKIIAKNLRCKTLEDKLAEIIK